MSNNILRLTSHDVLLFLGDLLPSIFPCIIRWRMSYLHLFRIICLKYWNFLHLTVVINLFPFRFYAISRNWSFSQSIIFSKFFCTAIVQMLLSYLKLFWLGSSFPRHTEELRTRNTSGIVFLK